MTSLSSLLLMASALFGTTQPAEAPVEEATTEAPAADAYEYTAADAAAEAAEAAREVLREYRADEETSAYDPDGHNWAIGRTFWTGKDWEVSENKHDCTLTNRSVSVLYDSRLEKIELSFVDSSIKSLRRGEIRPIRLSWLTDTEGYWAETLQMSARPLPDDSPRVTLMTGRVSSKGFLDYFARMKAIGFGTTKGVVINGWNLDGSAVGVVQLKKCAEQVSSARPSDPFTE